jgi:hypothetical protein
MAESLNTSMMTQMVGTARQRVDGRDPKIVSDLLRMR